MKAAVPIPKKLFEIYLLFTREPLVQCFTKELEFYSNRSGSLLGLISLDLTDNDYYGCILSRDESKQYRAETVEASIHTLEEARVWIDQKMSSDSIVFHDSTYGFFDLFQDRANQEKVHPYYRLLNEDISLSAAKEVMKEISYHYKDIDGNFIGQFQSLNGFDSRVWELFLFCFFREQFFSFKRDFNAPDYIIEKSNHKIAIEAVTISRKTEIAGSIPSYPEEIQKKLSNEVPLLFASALFDKMKKKYWDKEHVKDKPFVIAIADFHDTMSMTWTYTALSDYLYGYKYEHVYDKNGNIVVKPIKIGDYVKENGTKIPSGLFFMPGSEDLSAVIFSSCGTISKFNRMGKQAGFGNKKVTMIRTGFFYNHDPNADKPNRISYKVDERCSETWSEGVMIFHNPNAKNPLNPNIFDERVAQCSFADEFIYSKMPEYFPYNSITEILKPNEES